MFTPEEELRFLEAIVAALPPKDKVRMATGVRRLKLKGHTRVLVDGLLGEVPFELPGFTPKQIDVLRSTGMNILNSMTASTPVEEVSVSAGWQGNSTLFIDALRGIPEGLGASFADALARHENPGAQAYLLATGRTLPDVTPCPTLKGALPKGKSRDAVLACLRGVLAGGVAEAK